MMKKILSIAAILLAVMAIIAAVVAGLELEHGAFKQRGAGIHITPVHSKPIRQPAKGSTPFANSAGMPHVQGTQVLDGSGHPLLLHGAQIESAFNYINSWQQ